MRPRRRRSSTDSSPSSSSDSDSLGHSLRNPAAPSQVRSGPSSPQTVMPVAPPSTLAASGRSLARISASRLRVQASASPSASVEEGSNMDCESETDKLSPMNMVTPRNPSKYSISRVATLMKCEARPFDAELAHEQATMKFLTRIHPALIDKTPDATSPLQKRHSICALSDLRTPQQSLEQNREHHRRQSSSTSSVSVADFSQILAESTGVHLPRTIPIPDRDAKDPATYASHSSKLNPENLQMHKYFDTLMASPSLSPVHLQSLLQASGASPVGARGGSLSGKRRMSVGSSEGSTSTTTPSGGSEVFPQHQKRHDAKRRRNNPLSLDVANCSAGAGSNSPVPMSMPVSPVFLGGSSHTQVGTGGSNVGGTSTLSKFMAAAALQQPLLPGPVMGLMMPYMRRSTSASSAGSNADRTNIFGSSQTGSATPMVPGSPRVGVVFGNANVVLASPRGSMSAGSSSTPAGAPTSTAGTFGQMLNLGGFVSELKDLKF
ncbi:hypothetical protein HDU84_000055 [Entophlyctis sp. JEL0112]|nr:hypothetical protein HDU84_000055 [Entophlyctis sp. JEL0112]